MQSEGSEIIKVGVVGDGSLAKLLIMKLLSTDISVCLLEYQMSEYAQSSNISYYKSLTTLSRSCSIIVTILSDGPELENTLFDNQGIVSTAAAGNIIIDMSSVSPELIQEISEQLTEKDILFLDAAIIDEEQTESGFLQMILIGGDEDAYENVRTIFQRISKNVKYIGAHGASQFYRQAFAVRAKKVPS